MSDSETRPERKSITDRQRERKEKREARRGARLRGMRTKTRIREVTSVPMGSVPGVVPSPGVAPSPSPVATKSMWSDPRVLLGVAAALILFLRRKKS